MLLYYFGLYLKRFKQQSPTSYIEAGLYCLIKIPNLLLLASLSYLP